MIQLIETIEILKNNEQKLIKITFLIIGDGPREQMHACIEETNLYNADYSSHSGGLWICQRDAHQVEQYIRDCRQWDHTSTAWEASIHSLVHRSSTLAIKRCLRYEAHPFR